MNLDKSITKLTNITRWEFVKHSCHDEAFLCERREERHFLNFSSLKHSGHTFITIVMSFIGNDIMHWLLRRSMLYNS